MSVFAQIADWWDEQRARGDRMLDELMDRFIDAHPDWFGITVTTTALTAYRFTTTMAAGTVDILRLGTGIAEGGWGWAKDALRLLGIVGPAASAIKRLAAVPVAVDAFPMVGNCTWVAATRALRLSGVRLFARLEDLCAAAGIGVNQMGGLWLNQIQGALQQLGARVGQVLALPMGNGNTNLKALEAVAKQNRGAVVMTSWVSQQQVAGQAPQIARHTVVAFADAAGRVRILDRNGKVVLLSAYEKFATSLFGLSGPVTFEQYMVLHNARFFPAANATSVLSHLGLAVEAKFTGDRRELEKLRRGR